MLIMHIGFLACFHAISLERSRFSKIATLFFMRLVSLISRLVACSPRIVVDKQTDRHTHRTTTVIGTSVSEPPLVDSTDAHKMKKRRTVADFVANVGESGDRDRCLGTSVSYLGVNTRPWLPCRCRKSTSPSGLKSQIIITAFPMVPKC